MENINNKQNSPDTPTNHKTEKRVFSFGTRGNKKESVYLSSWVLVRIGSWAATIFPNPIEAEDEKNKPGEKSAALNDDGPPPASQVSIILLQFPFLLAAIWSGEERAKPANKVIDDENSDGEKQAQGKQR